MKYTCCKCFTLLLFMLSALMMAAANDYPVSWQLDASLDNIKNNSGLLQTQANVVAFSPWLGKKDLSVKYQAVANYSGLYLRFDVEDDAFCQPYSDAAKAWQGDSIQLAFALTPKSGMCDLEICLWLSPSGPRYAVYIPTGDNSFRKVEVAIDKHSTGMVYRCFIPWKTLYPFNPFESHSLKASFVVNDNDGKGRKGYMELSKGIGDTKLTAAYWNFTLPSELNFSGPALADFSYLYPVSLFGEKDSNFMAVLYAGRKSGSPGDCTVVAGASGKIIDSRKVAVPEKRIIRQTLSFNLDKRYQSLDSFSCYVGNVSNGYDVKLLDLSGVRQRYAAIRKACEVLQEKCVNDKINSFAAQSHGALIEVFFPAVEQRIERRDVKGALRIISSLEALLKKYEQAVVAGDPAEPLLTKALLAESPGFAAPAGQVVNHDGWFYCNGRPVWINGFNGFVRIHRDYRPLSQMGLTAVTLDLDGKTYIKTPDSGRDQLPEYFSGSMANAAKYSMVLLPQIPFHYLPAWVYSAYPEGKVNNTFWSFSPFHPAVKPVLERMYRNAAVVMNRDARRIPFVNLTNEPFVFDFSDTGKDAGNCFIAYLRKHYSSINDLNSRWKTGYSDFSQVEIPWKDMTPPDWSRVSYPAYYDWLTFRREAISDFFVWMNDCWRKYSSIPVSHKLLGSGFSHDEIVGQPSYRTGIDPERIIANSDLAGLDMGMGHSTLGKEELYGRVEHVDCINNHFGYDFARSFSKTGTLVNTENHLIKNAAPEISYPAEMLRAMLWGQVMHGMAASAIWVWEEIPNNRDLADTVLSRPDSLAGIVQATAEINRFLPLIIAANTRPKLALLYSWPSHIKNPRHFSSLLKVYQAMLFHGYDIGFITDRGLRDGKDDQYDAIVAPEATLLDAAAWRRLNAFAASGKTLISVGPVGIANEYGEPRSESISGNVKYLDSKLPVDAIRTGLEKIFASLHLMPEYQLKSLSGKPLTGVEWKTVTRRDAAGKPYRIYFIVNWNHVPVDLQLTGNQQPFTAHTDLFSGKNGNGVLHLDRYGVAVVAVTACQ